MCRRVRRTLARVLVNRLPVEEQITRRMAGFLWLGVRRYGTFCA